MTMKTPTTTRVSSAVDRAEARSMTHRITSQREKDLATLAAGGHTGWWDEHGQPAPFPDDFFDPGTGWRPTSTNTPPELDHGEQPF